MLMLSAGVAVALALWRESRRALSVYFWAVSAIFAFALIDNIIARPDGVIIASAFILIMIALSAISRYARTAQLRIFDVTFADDNTGHLWAGMIGKKVHLAPLRINSPQARERRAREISKRYALGGPLAFIHVKLLDNRSEWVLPYQIRVWREKDDYVLEVRGAIAIANTIAHISDLIDPISIVLRSTRQTFSSRLRFLVLGDGATGLLVRTILVKYWRTTREERARPLIVLMSD